MENFSENNGDNTKKHTVTKTIRMPEDLVSKLEKKATENNKNFSNLVIHILTKYLDLTKED